MTCGVPACEWPVSEAMPICGQHFAHLSDSFQHQVLTARGTPGLDAVLESCVKYLAANQRRADETARVRAQLGPSGRTRRAVRHPKMKRGDGQFRPYEP